MILLDFLAAVGAKKLSKVLGRFAMLCAVNDVYESSKLNTRWLILGRGDFEK